MKIQKLVHILLIATLFVACGESKEGETDTKADNKSEKTDSVAAQVEIPTPFLGESMQIMIGTKNYDESMKFYSTLGWKQHNTGKIDDMRWTQLFDGSMMIMIVEDTVEYIGPGYFSSNAEPVFKKMDEIEGLYVMDIERNGKPFQKITFDSDSLGISVIAQEGMEMPEFKNVSAIWGTMDMSLIEFPNPVSGTFQEFAVTVEDLDASIAYLEQLGFQNNGVKSMPYRYTHMFDGLVTIGLHEAKDMWHGMAFTYSGESKENNKAAAAALEEAGFGNDITEMEWEGVKLEGNYLIEDPNGHIFFLTTDFAKKK